ncbi:MAG: type II toxin-antitoxin system VapC family toxin [Chloroflexota bacterium]
MKRALLDTSVVIGLVHEWLEFTDPPDVVAISVVTLCELHYGVLAATDAKRPLRLRTLDWVRHNCDVLSAGDDVAPRYGQLMAEAKRATGAKPDARDALIAATAMARHIPVLTRDKDFKAFKGVEVILV